MRACGQTHLKANWQTPKHSSYLWQTEQARKLDTVVSFPLEFDHGAQVWTWPAPHPLSPSIFAPLSMTENVYNAASD